jgi:hypothetical protein
MSLTFVPKIFDPLSLNVKLHQCKNFFFWIINYSPQRVAPIIDYLFFNYYKFVNMNATTLQDLLLLSFKNCSKNYDCGNPLSINQTKKDHFMPF